MIKKNSKAFRKLVRLRAKQLGMTYQAALQSMPASEAAPSVLAPPHGAAPPADWDDLADSPWEVDAKESLARAMESLEWDDDEGVVRVPGERGPLVFESLEDLQAYLMEAAFEGYNNSAPRDSGEWVFEFDGADMVSTALSDHSEQLQALGWW